MTRREMIRLQLKTGLPEGWITDELVEALEFARGGVTLKYPAPDLADPRHGIALLKFAAAIEDGHV